MAFWIAPLIGAGIGATLAGTLGPKEEPLWKKLLVGGGLGAVAGYGAGAAGVGAGGTAAAGSGALAGTTAGAGGLGAGTASTATAAELTAANAAAASEFTIANYGSAQAAQQAAQYAALNAVPAVPGVVPLSASLAPTTFTAGGNLTAAEAAANLGTQPGMFSQAGATMANNPFTTAGLLGSAGYLALQGDSGDRNRSDAAETYPQDASWEGGTSRSTPTFYGSSSPGGVGRSFYDPERFRRNLYYR